VAEIWLLLLVLLLVMVLGREIASELLVALLKVSATSTQMFIPCIRERATEV
jgi:hypothetical protein